MKDNKICFSRTLTYLVLLVVVVVGAFYLLNSLNSKKLTSNTEAKTAGNMSSSGYAWDELTCKQNFRCAYNLSKNISIDKGVYRYKCIKPNNCVGINPVNGSNVGQMCKWADSNNDGNFAYELSNNTSCDKAGSLPSNACTGKTGKIKELVGTVRKRMHGPNEYQWYVDARVYGQTYGASCLTEYVNCCYNNDYETAADGTAYKSDAEVELVVNGNCSRCLPVTRVEIDSGCTSLKGKVEPKSIKYVNIYGEQVKSCVIYNGSYLSYTNLWGNKCSYSLENNVPSTSSIREQNIGQPWLDLCGK